MMAPVNKKKETSEEDKSSDENENSGKKGIKITPEMYQMCLNAYKLSPDYANLKKKRFNTGFIFEKRRGDRDIQIFTPEEENSPKWTENLPVIESRIQGEPGQKYANIFMSIPGLDEFTKEGEEEVEVEAEAKPECSSKKGRKKSVGDKGVPLPPDESLTTNYAELLKKPEKPESKPECSSKKGKKKSVGDKGVPLPDE